MFPAKIWYFQSFGLIGLAQFAVVVVYSSLAVDCGSGLIAYKWYDDLIRGEVTRFFIGYVTLIMRNSLV